MRGLINIVLNHPLAKLPTVSEGDAGCDLFAAEIWEDYQLDQTHVNFGISIEIPEGYVGLIFPRSSIRGFQYRLSNSVGVIDPSYRGDWKAVFDNRQLGDSFQVGYRVAQFVIVPRYVVTGFNQVDSLSETTRGVGGYGSTGND
jgi:dUTP pyrophosphatase